MGALGFYFLYPEKGCRHLGLVLEFSLISIVEVDKVFNFYWCTGALVLISTPLLCYQWVALRVVDLG